MQTEQNFVTLYPIRAIHSAVFGVLMTKDVQIHLSSCQNIVPDKVGTVTENFGFLQ